jgi:hypothetical protein
MSKRKIILRIPIEWDTEAWELTYGATADELWKQQQDVTNYVTEQINGSAAADECGLRVAWKDKR